MSFEFIARTADAKTQKVRVIADREAAARTKLEDSGYSVVALVGVTAVKSSELVIHTTNSKAFRAAKLPNKKVGIRRHWKLTNLVAEFFAPFNLLG